MGIAERSNGRGHRDEFVSSVNYLEIIGGGLFRVTFYVNVANANDSNLECVPADFSLVMPLTALPDAIGKALVVSSRTIFARPDGSLTLMQ